MITDARLWNIGGIHMYVTSAGLLTMAVGNGNPVPILGGFLNGLAGGLFLLVGSKRAPSRP